MLGKPDIRAVLIGIQRDRRDAVVQSLGRAGLIHLAVELPGQEWDADAHAELQTREQQTRARLTMTGGLLDALGEKPVSGAYDLTRQDFDEQDIAAAAVREKLERFQTLRAKLRGSIDLLRRRLAYAGLAGDTGAGLAICSMLFGIVPQDFSIPLPDPALPFVVRHAGQRAVVIALASQCDEVVSLLHRYGFQTDSAVAVPGCELKRADTLALRIAVLERRDAALGAWFEHQKPAWADTLQNIHAVCSAHLQALAAARTFAFTAEAVFIRGWIDIVDSGRIEMLLHGLCGNRFTFVVSALRENNAPVLLRNNRFSRPFELLVRNIGIPAQHEIDPTLLTALSYMLLFGVMFGDVGQGLIIALTGYAVQRFSRRRAAPDSLPAQIGGIMVPCGISAVIFGLLYGSCFSSEKLLPALWFHPMEHIDRLFFAAIAMGVLFISAGIVLNIINRISQGDMTEALFGKFGMAGLAFYAGAVFIGLRYYSRGTAPGLPEIILLICVPVSLHVCKDLLGCYLLRQGPPGRHGLLEKVIETLVEVLDLFSGFLANTISFIRAGAFALSHAGLSVATYSLAAMVDPNCTSAGAVAVIVLGNIVIIAFEGLICAIQSMRLEYYEFYGKFYQGSGVPFRPFVLQAERP